MPYPSSADIARFVELSDEMDEPMLVIRGSLGDMVVGEGEVVELGGFGRFDATNSLPEDFRERFVQLFDDPDRAKETTIYGGSSEKIPEERGVGKTFVRVCAADLYAMTDEKGNHFVDDLYRGPLLRAVRTTLGNDAIVPFDAEEELDYAYVGNGLMKPAHEFPMHEDTPGTVSALLFVSDIMQMNDESGVFKVAWERGQYSAEDLRQGCGAGIFPEAGWAVIFVGDKLHGGLAIDPKSPPRLAVAFSYKDPARYKDENRDTQFRAHRQSRTASRAGGLIVLSA